MKGGAEEKVGMKNEIRKEEVGREGKWEKKKKEIGQDKVKKEDKTKSPFCFIVSV
jgi:hypothetical protein